MPSAEVAVQRHRHTGFVSRLPWWVGTALAVYLGAVVWVDQARIDARNHDSGWVIGSIALALATPVLAGVAFVTSKITARRLWVHAFTTCAAAVVVAIVVSVVGFGRTISESSTGFQKFSRQLGQGLNAAFDPTGKGVAITSCRPDAAGRVEIRGTAHNASVKPTRYVIGVFVDDAAGKGLYDGTATTPRIAAGKTATWAASPGATYRTGMTCKLVAVVR